MIRLRLVRASVLFAAAAVVMAVAASGALADNNPGVVFAAPAGVGNTCSVRNPCNLATALTKAPSGSVVFALQGTYRGGLAVTKSLTLIGEHAVIDGSTAPNMPGLQILASNTRVQGFTVENANLEGILVGSSPVDAGGNPASSGAPLTGVTIQNNVLTHNDTGFSGTVGTGFGECFTTPFAPGDCGEALHLVSTTHSVVRNNLITGNAGGILLTDEFGPAAHNVVLNNVSTDNNDDCGITLASHTPAGVFSNLVEGNIADRNGVAGQGGGILMAAAGPVGGAWDNVIRFNEASGNGLAGIVIHDHFAGANLNGNVLEYNRLSNDNLDGDTDFAAAQDPQTTGILIAAGLPFPGPAIPPITGTVVRGNFITNVAVGIWTLNVPATSNSIAHNFFGPGVTPISPN
jgi:nitrous oxidase accessory protein NosD